MDLFVSLNPARPVAVARFGTGLSGQRANTLIGAQRDLNEPSRVAYDLGAVVRIPDDEAQLFRREYDRAIRCGDLVRRTAAEYEAASSAGMSSPKPSSEAPPDPVPDRTGVPENGNAQGRRK